MAENETLDIEGKASHRWRGLRKLICGESRANAEASVPEGNVDAGISPPGVESGWAEAGDIPLACVRYACACPGRGCRSLDKGDA